MTETERLKKELAEARAEIENLKLQLSNVTFMLKKEMKEAGKLPKEPGGGRFSN